MAAASAVAGAGVLIGAPALRPDYHLRHAATRHRHLGGDRGVQTDGVADAGRAIPIGVPGGLDGERGRVDGLGICMDGSAGGKALGCARETDRRLRLAPDDGGIVGSPVAS